MIDIGLNLSNPQFDADRDAVVQRARDAGVEALILTGTDLAESRAAADLAQRWPGYAFSTTGVHPHDARHWDAASGDDLNIHLGGLVTGVCARQAHPAAARAPGRSTLNSPACPHAGGGENGIAHKVVAAREKALHGGHGNECARPAPCCLSKTL